jgi:hypothetical protein
MSFRDGFRESQTIRTGVIGSQPAPGRMAAKASPPSVPGVDRRTNVRAGFEQVWRPSKETRPKQTRLTPLRAGDPRAAKHRISVPAGLAEGRRRSSWVAQSAEIWNKLMRLFLVSTSRLAPQCAIESAHCLRLRRMSIWSAPGTNWKSTGMSAPPRSSHLHSW